VIIEQEAAQETCNALIAERAGINSKIDSKKAELQAANNSGNSPATDALRRRLIDANSGFLDGNAQFTPIPSPPVRVVLHHPNTNAPSQTPHVTPSAPLPDEPAPGNGDNNSEPPPEYEPPREPPPRYQP